MRWKLTTFLVPVFKMRSSFIGHLGYGFIEGHRAVLMRVHVRVRMRSVAAPASADLYSRLSISGVGYSVTSSRIRGSTKGPNSTGIHRLSLPSRLPTDD